jgi:hypothetical protein
MQQRERVETEIKTLIQQIACRKTLSDILIWDDYSMGVEAYQQITIEIFTSIYH